MTTLLNDTIAVLSRRLPQLAWMQGPQFSIKGTDAPIGSPSPPTYSITIVQAAGSYWRVNVWMCAIDADSQPMRSYDYPLPSPNAEAFATAVLAAVHEYGRGMEARAKELLALARHAQALWIGAQP